MKIIVLVLIAVAATALSGCGRRPIVIGFQGPLTGPPAELGVQGRNGAQLAVEQINDGGGVRGQALRLDPRDDRNRREVAYEVVRAFQEADVEVVIGPMTSVAGLAVAEQVAETGPLYVSPTVSTPKVSGRDDFFLRLQAATDRPAMVLGSYAVQELGAERVAVIADTTNSEYSTPFVDAFSEGLGAYGGEVVVQFDAPMSATSRWRSMMQAIAAENPDTVLIVASATDSARFSQVVRDAEPEVLILGSGWAATETLPTMGGASVEGMVLARMSYGALGSTSQGSEFYRRFRRRFGRAPSFAASRAYDAVMVVARALNNVTADAADLRRELAALNRFETLLGPVTFNSTGDVEPSAAIIRVEGGEFVEIAEYGTGLREP